MRSPFRSGVTLMILRVAALAALSLGQLATPAPMAWAAPTPSTSITLPAATFVGEPVTFTVSFANTGGVGEVGYGPYLNVELPIEGADGAGAAADDGLSFTSASYLGSTLTPLIPPFPCTGNYTHPLTGQSTACTAGRQVVILQLPFGSFAVGQPGADVQITAAMSNLADVGTALPIRATGGFAYGNLPTGGTPITGSTATANVTPTLFTLTKTYVGPEDETATGPNYPRQYQITVDIANGQTLTNLDLTDVLTDSIQYLSTDSVVAAVGSPTVTGVVTPSLSIPGGTLTRRLSAATGTAGANDASMTFSYFVPLLRATSTDVLDPITGDDRLAPDDAQASASWTPIDVRDAAGPVSSNVTASDHVLEEQSIAIQKGVSIVTDNAPAGYSPDDVVEYTLDIQISDYFAFNDVIVTDTFSDGQRWDSTFTPTLQVNGNTYTLAAAGMNAANYTVDISEIAGDVDPSTDGSTTVTFYASDELVTRGRSDAFIGGCVPETGTTGPAPDCSYNDGATTAQIVFRAVVQQDFSDTYPSGDPSVDQGDVLTNTVSIDGAVLDVADAATPTGQREADDSGAQFELAKGVLEKTIYAINGSICPGGCTSVIIEPGDTVTYRFTYTLPQTDFEALVFTDYLPLPVFDATSINPAFDPTVSASAPAAGTAKYGPSDTQYVVTNITPDITTTVSSNTVAFGFRDFDDALDRSTVVDVLFTVTVSANPFVDGLFLTNQVRASEGTTNAGSQVDDSIVMIELGEPELAVQKGVVTTNGAGGTFAPATVGPVTFTAPGTAGVPWSSGIITTTLLTGTPINSNLSGIDAGDLATFVITLQNTGGADAFDVVITDTLPAGFVVPSSGAGLNLRVYDGERNAVSYTSLAGGLFGSGIRLDDPSALLGGIPAGRDTGGPIITGDNVIVIAYDLQAADTIAPNSAQVNTAGVINVAGSEGGPTHPTSSLTDTATVTSRNVAAVKTVVATSEAHTTGNNLAIGEIVRYRLAVTLPEGVATNVQLIDALPNGLTFLDDNSARISFICDGGMGCLTSSTLTTTVISGSAPVTPLDFVPGSAISGGPFNTGTDVTFGLGNLTNADRDANSEYVVIEFNALLDNSATGSNDANETRQNTVRVNVSGTQLTTANAPNVTIVEPVVTVNKTANPTNLDNGDTVTYTVIITNTSGTARSTAYELVITDIVPSELTLTGGSVSITGGGTITTTGNAITATLPSLAVGSSATMTYAAVLDNLTFGTPITNTARATFTSLPGIGTTGNATGSNTPGASGATNGERDGSGGGINDYIASDPATITAPPSLVKSIIDTSEDATTGSNLAIGEIVRYRLVSGLPESTVPNFQISDNLPAGLTFLDDNTARVAFICNGGAACVTSSDGSIGSSPVINGAAAVAPTFQLPDAAISPSSFVDGTDPVFSLGNLVNTDNDGDNEYVVIEFNAIATNNVSNIDGRSLSNTFSVSVNGASLGTSNSVSATIVKPTVNVAKVVVAPAPSDAGDTLTYRITYTNTATTAPAFDLTISDTLPALMVGPFTVTSSTTSGACGSTAASITHGVVGQDLTSTLACLGPTASATVTVTGSVDPTAIVHSTITNTATLTWSTLPGAYGTTSNATGSNTPGDPDTVTGEDVTTANATATVTLVSPALDKLQPSPANYTIGDVITYTIVITTPEGTTPNLVVTDTLPTGLSYISSQIVTSAPLSNGLLSGDFSGTITATPIVTNNGTSARFAFGDVVAAADNVTTNNRFLLIVLARVDNVLSNQRTVTRVNTANMSYGNGTPAGTTTVTDPTGGTITIVEPILSLTKTILTPATPADAAGAVTYQLVIRHAAGSGSVAYDTILSDTLPSGLINGTVTGVTASNVAAPSASVSGGVLTLPDSGSLDLPVNGVVTVTVQAELDATVTPAQVINNLAALTWTTQPGVNANERGSGNGLLNAGGLNDYEVRSNVAFNVDDPAVAKRLVATSATNTSGTNVTIGEVVTYAIDVTLPEGTTPTLVVTDALPSGLIYVPGSAALDTTLFAGSVATPTVSGGASDGDDVILTFPSAVTVTGDNNTSNDTFSILLNARVNNTAPNQSGQTRVNSATVNAAGVVLATNTVTVTVVEPDLSLSIGVDDATPAFGQVLTYTVNAAVTGSSTSPAEDVVITVTIPSGLTYVNGSVTTPAGWSVDTSTPGQLVFTIAEWTAGSIAPTFQATVANSPAVNLGDVLTVPASATWTSLPGVDSGERTGAGGVDDYSRNTNVPVTVSGIDLTIVKTDADISTTPGGVITYTLTITNSGNVAATGVVITDTLPTYTSFVSASNGGTASAGVVTWSVGSLGVWASTARTLAVQVDAAVPFGVTDINNSAHVSDDGATGPDLDPADNSDTEITPIGGLNVDLQLIKDDGVATATPGQTLVYTLTVTNVGTTTATGVVVTDTIPAHTSFVSASNGGTLSAGVVTWPSTSLAGGGATITRTLTVIVDNPLAAGVSTIHNAALVIDDGASGNDANPNDNEAGDTDVVNAAPDVSVVKDDGLTLVAAGQDVTYTLTINNVGNIDVTGVTVTDTVPAELTFVAASNGGTESAGVVSWPAFDLAAGATVTRTVTFTVGGAVPEGTTITNPAQVADDGSNGADVDPSNNSSTDVDTVDNIVDLQLVKSQPAGGLVIGLPITYTLTYTNAGNVAASGVVITETVPTYTTFSAIGSTAGWSCADGSAAGTTCTLTIGNLSVGASGLATFVVNTIPTLPGGATVTNTATVGDDGTHGADPTPPNNESTVGGVPTAVELIEFVAERGEGDSVHLRWVVGQQIDTLGYRILRSPGGDPAAEVEVGYVAARLESGDIVYTFDDAPGAGSWTYTLIELDSYGQETRYPQTARLDIGVAQPLRLFLPSLTR